MHRLTIRAAFLAAVVVFVALVTAAATHAVPPSDRYTVTPLVSDVPGVAPLTDRISSTPGALRAARRVLGG